MNWNRISKRITPRALAEFVKAYGHWSPVPDAGHWRARVTCGDWFIETDEASHSARVRNVRDGEQICDTESALYFALKTFLTQQPRTGIGLVLAGGGAKGAYQVGVWRALCESGLAAQVTGISGVSIGAINTPLFLRGDWREAYELWLQLSDPDFRRVQRAEIERITRAYGRRHGQSILPPELLEIMEDIFISQPELERHLLPVIKSISPDTFREFALYSAVTPLEEVPFLLPGLLDPETPSFPGAISDETAHYISWRGLSNMDMTRLLMASSAIPPAYDPVTFRGKAYYDGGFYDNVPIFPLYREGFRKFIVVDLKRKQGRPWRIPSGDSTELCEFRVVRPGSGFDDDFLAVFELTPEITRERVRHGYEDALRVLEGFDAHNEEKFYGC
ncbi:MAG: patatin-like phospholipase family protein [Oscillospiraceae bacterium]|nr:patatin-like phospholipase family protein [Oscillospiraceae bacterium]